MLSEVSQASGSRVFSNLGLAALEVALTQQKVFEETLQELAERQEQAKIEQERKAAEENGGEEQDAPASSSSEHVVDVIVGGRSSTAPDVGTGDAVPDTRGSQVDVAV